MASQPRQATIKQIKNTGTKDEGDRFVVEHSRRQALHREERGFDNAKRRSKATEEISRRHQIRQEVDFGLVGMLGVHPGNLATGVSPPRTLSPI